MSTIEKASNLSKREIKRAARKFARKYLRNKAQPEKKIEAFTTPIGSHEVGDRAAKELHKAKIDIGELVWNMYLAHYKTDDAVDLAYRVQEGCPVWEIEGAVFEKEIFKYMLRNGFYLESVEFHKLIPYDDD